MTDSEIKLLLRFLKENKCITNFVKYTTEHHNKPFKKYLHNINKDNAISCAFAWGVDKKIDWLEMYDKYMTMLHDKFRKEEII